MCLRTALVAQETAAFQIAQCSKATVGPNEAYSTQT